MLNRSKSSRLKPGGGVKMSRFSKGFMHSVAYKRLLNFLGVGHMGESGQGPRSILDYSTHWCNMVLSSSSSRDFLIYGKGRHQWGSREP